MTKPQTSPSQRTNWTRFSLLNLMALSTIVAVWLPWWISRDEPERLQTEIDLMNQSLGTLVINDPGEFVAVKMAKVSYDLETWRFRVPNDVRLEACLAVEGIHKLALPEKFERFELPSGQHELSLIAQTDREKGFRHEVYLDGKLKLSVKHPPEWLDSGGSSSLGEIASVSKVYDAGNPLNLQRLVYCPVVRTGEYNSRHLAPDPLASAKGCFLWLQPMNHVGEPAREWIDDFTQPAYPRQLGLREGIRLRKPTQFSGLRVHHPECMTHQEPVVTFFMDFESDKPDTSLSTRTSKTGTWNLSGKRDEFVQPNLNLDHQPQQSVYFIYEPFAEMKSNRKILDPVVEVIFDLNHPDELGFRLIQSEDGIACDRWNITAVHPLGQYWQTVMTSQGQWTVQDDRQLIDLDALPPIAYKQSEYRLLEIRSPCENPDDWLKLNVPSNERFRAMPQRHSWLIPEPVSVEQRGTDFSLKVIDKKDDFALTPIVGGPVISEISLDIDQPDNSILWYRIDVQPFDDSAPIEGDYASRIPPDA